MATSRTGTTRWKNVRAKVIRQAQRDGIDHCPRCNVLLDYSSGERKRNSVEVDHIVPHSQGGTDTVDNAQVVCGRCNRSLGSKRNKMKPKPLPAVTLATSRAW